MYHRFELPLLPDDAPARRYHEEAAMREYIDRVVAGIRRGSRHRITLVPVTGRPRRARTTFVPPTVSTALSH